MACALPAECDVPLSRWSHSELASEAISRGILDAVSTSTIRRWLTGSRSWIFPRDPDFQTKAARVLRRLAHMDELQHKSRDINTRLLDTERVGQGLILASPAFERATQSILTEDGRRAPALRFGDPRVMALLGALCMFRNVLGFTNKSLRAQVSMLLGIPYRMNQMSYDLSRLTRKNLIQRIPKTNTYTVTSDGLRIALFYTKVHDRLFIPLCTADQPPAPVELRDALRTIDTHVETYIDRARLGKAA